MTTDCTLSRQYDRNAGLKFAAEDTDLMPKSDRENAVLSLLAEIGEPLPPVLIYRILRVRGATFGRRSVMRYCSELGERGDLLKIDPEAMNDGELLEQTGSQKGYWMITEQGRERVGGE